MTDSLTSKKWFRSPQRYFLDAPKEQPGTCFVRNDDYVEAVEEIERLQQRVVELEQSREWWKRRWLEARLPQPPDAVLVRTLRRISEECHASAREIAAAGLRDAGLAETKKAPPLWRNDKCASEGCINPPIDGLFCARHAGEKPASEEPYCTCRESYPSHLGHQDDCPAIRVEDEQHTDSLIEKLESVVAGETVASLTASDVVVGRHYIWEPTKKLARCRVIVDEVRHDPNGDVRVFTTTVEGGLNNPIGLKTWNDMSRFLEACVAVSENDDIR